MENAELYKDDVFKYILDNYKVTFEVKPKLFNGQFFKGRSVGQQPNHGDEIDNILIDLFLDGSKVTDIKHYLSINNLDKDAFYYQLLCGIKGGYWTMKVNQKLPKFEFEQGKELFE